MKLGICQPSKKGRKRAKSKRASDRTTPNNTTTGTTGPEEAKQRASWRGRGVGGGERRLIYFGFRWRATGKEGFKRPPPTTTTLMKT